MMMMIKKKKKIMMTMTLISFFARHSSEIAAAGPDGFSRRSASYHAIGRFFGGTQAHGTAHERG